MKYRPSSPARTNWHSSTIAKGGITVYMSWKSADVLWKFKSILLFPSCTFNSLTDTSRNWAFGVRESGISSPCWERSWSLHISWTISCIPKQLGKSHGFGMWQSLPWCRAWRAQGHSWWLSVELCGLSKRMCCSLADSDCTKTRSTPWESPCLLQTCRQALLGSWGALSTVLRRGKIQPCCMPAVVRGDTSETNLAQCIFYSSRCSRAATDIHGKKANTVKTPQTKAFHETTDT